MRAAMRQNMVCQRDIKNTINTFHPGKMSVLEGSILVSREKSYGHS